MKQPHVNVKFWYKETSNISDLSEIGDGTVIHSHVSIHNEVKIGKNCQIEAYVFIPNGVTLEAGVFIGPHVCFTNDPRLDTSRGEFKPTSTLVKKNAKIGANATIRAGVTIGEGAVIGCGSVVLNDIPASQIWVGNPAKLLT